MNNNSLLKTSDFKGFTGWITFRGIIDIIVGAFACLGFVTATYGIPRIIAGIKLLNAADELKYYINTNDNERFQMVLLSFYKYFKLSSISVIIKIGFIILLFTIYLFLFIFAFNTVTDLIRNFPSRDYF
jgi:hypothetical protein